MPVVLNGAGFCDDQVPVLSTIGRGPIGPRGAQGPKGDTGFANYAVPIEWDIDTIYRKNTIVLDNGNSYISLVDVPAGIDISNSSYWMMIGENNAQVDELRQQMLMKACAFDTVADMKDSDILYVDAICHTNGFHSAGDGGAAWYKVSDFGTANEIDVIALKDDLYANLVIAGNSVTPEMFGAYGDGSHDDTTSINTALSYCNKNCSYTDIPTKNYKTSNTIRVIGSSTISSYGNNCATVVNFFGTINYDGVGSAIEIDGYYLDINIAMLKCSNGNGVRIGENLRETRWCNINIGAIHSKGKCLYLNPSLGTSGSTADISYLDIKFLCLRSSNDFALCIDASGNYCWIGDNKFYGGNAYSDNAYGVDINGRYSIQATTSITGNKFINVSCEGSNKGFSLNNCSFNLFTNPRFNEFSATATCIEFKDNCCFNKFEINTGTLFSSQVKLSAQTTNSFSQNEITAQYLCDDNGSSFYEKYVVYNNKLATVSKVSYGFEIGDYNEITLGTKQDTANGLVLDVFTWLINTSANNVLVHLPYSFSNIKTTRPFYVRGPMTLTDYNGNVIIDLTTITGYAANKYYKITAREKYITSSMFYTIEEITMAKSTFY